MQDVIKFDQPEQYPLDEILNEDERLARGWASVEIKDHDDEKIMMEEFRRIMNIWMDRGAPIADTHTNRIVGKGLTWKEGTNPRSKKPGILIDYKIHKHYKTDDQVWDAIKVGKRKGLSIGGRVDGKVLEKDDDGKSMLRRLAGLEMFEISSVENPANPEALNVAVNYLAKGGSAEIKKELTPEQASLVDDLIHYLRERIPGLKTEDTMTTDDVDKAFPQAQPQRVTLPAQNPIPQQQPPGAQQATAPPTTPAQAAAPAAPAQQPAAPVAPTFNAIAQLQQLLQSMGVAPDKIATIVNEAKPSATSDASPKNSGGEPPSESLNTQSHGSKTATDTEATMAPQDASKSGTDAPTERGGNDGALDTTKMMAEISKSLSTIAKGMDVLIKKAEATDGKMFPPAKEDKPDEDDAKKMDGQTPGEKETLPKAPVGETDESAKPDGDKVTLVEKAGYRMAPTPRPAADVSKAGEPSKDHALEILKRAKQGPIDGTELSGMVLGGVDDIAKSRKDKIEGFLGNIRASKR